MSYDLCQVKTASKPYYIENISTYIYSIEELCYYLYNNMYLIDRSIVGEELCNWIRDELDLKRLYRQLCDQLLKTESAILAKCSDNSRTWSCGFGLGDASRLDIAQWKGSNMMGFTLMAVRDEIRRRER